MSINNIIAGIGNNRNYAASFIDGGLARKRGTLLNDASKRNALERTSFRNAQELNNNTNRLLQNNASVGEIAQVNPGVAAKIQGIQSQGRKDSSEMQDKLRLDIGNFGYNRALEMNPDSSIDPSFAAFDNNSPLQLQLRAANSQSGRGQQININSGDKLNAEEKLQLKLNETRGVEAIKANQKRFSSIFEKVTLEGDSARDLEDKLKLQLSINAQTGAGEDAIDKGRRGLVAIGRLFGLEDEDMNKMTENITNLSQFRAIQEDLVGARLRAEIGVKTDGDADRMRTTLANINNPVEANKFIIRMLLSDASRKKSRQRFYANEQASGAQNADEISRQWNKYVDDTPIFGKSPTTGKTLFFNEFTESLQNEDVGEVTEEWKKYYTGSGK